MTNHFVTAWVLLAYLLLPLLAYLVYWLYKKFRKGGTGAEPGEGEA